MLFKTIVGQNDHDLAAAVRDAEAKAEAFLKGLAPGVVARLFKVETLPYKAGAAHIITFVMSE